MKGKTSEEEVVESEEKTIEEVTSEEEVETGELKGAALLQAKAQELICAIEKERLYRISINKSGDRFYYAKQMVERLIKNQLID